MKLRVSDINYRDLSGFKELTRQLTNRSDEPEAIESVIFQRPKYRRSISPELVRYFLQLARDKQVSDMFEIGVMDGRHTEMLLDANDWCVHSFEPNPYCMPSLLRFANHDRHRLLPFAVSDTDGFAQLSLPSRFLGSDVPLMSGISTLKRHLDEDAASNELPAQLVATITGRTYIERFACCRPHSIALWIDTEGCALDVLLGFQELLKAIPLVIAEVEYGPHFSSGPNWNDVVMLLKQSGHSVIARDWQQEGQCNIVSLNEAAIRTTRNNDSGKTYFELMALCREL